MLSQEPPFPVLDRPIIVEIISALRGKPRREPKIRPISEKRCRPKSGLRRALKTGAKISIAILLTEALPTNSFMLHIIFFVFMVAVLRINYDWHGWEYESLPFS